MTPPPRDVGLDALPDVVLCERATDGDTAAFEVLARRYGPMMRGYAMRLTGSTADADDAVQETLIHAWDHLADVRDGSVVKSWLMRICGRRSIDIVRRRREHADADTLAGVPDHRPTPESATIAGSGLDSLARSLEALPAEQRQCWVLKEMGGLSYEEIAEQLGISSESVRGRLARARVTLMKDMEGWR
ncbi:sigma-70 family RNA polymerase sigma factor [Arthrobacter agilis]|uniref:RNA polymerase sigma factor n=1 Tax=Arthrobacter agilis TaxID=37921 RepID=UPI002365D27B|nr:sigma-70 family RNA polymerase sigma factor [Arthrobacter agilis]WDF34136.1 sigma-70 family RNA polymerase sigma factor [Arthrobacter agilis]